MSSKSEEKTMSRIESARSFSGHNNRDSSIISSTVKNNTSDSYNNNHNHTTIFQFVIDPNVDYQSRNSLINRIVCQQTQQTQHTQQTYIINKNYRPDLPPSVVNWQYRIPDYYVYKEKYNVSWDDIWGSRLPSKTECGDEENVDESNEILKGAKYGSDESDIDKSASNKSAADGDNDKYKNRKRKRCGDFDQEPQQKKRKIMENNKNKLSSIQLLREMEINQKIKELDCERSIRSMELALVEKKKKHIALMRSITQKEGKQWTPYTLNNGTTGVRCIQAKNAKVCNRMFVTLNEWCNHECE